MDNPQAPKTENNARENTMSLLEALQKLKDSGVLSEEEFQRKVQEVRNRYRTKTSVEHIDSERRKSRRKQVRYFLSILDQTTKKQLGLLVDINTEGAMIIRETPLEIGKTLKLRILLPEPIHGNHFIDIEGTSTWSEKDIHPNFYATGFKFDQVGKETKLLIVRLMNLYGVMTMDEPPL
jgi:hypothetical protein